jgi:hypothetical protein
MDSAKAITDLRISSVTVTGLPAVVHVESEANTYSRRSTLEWVSFPEPPEAAP